MWYISRLNISKFLKNWKYLKFYLTLIYANIWLSFIDLLKICKNYNHFENKKIIFFIGRNNNDYIIINTPLFPFSDTKQKNLILDILERNLNILII